jgi:hypothetical protein
MTRDELTALVNRRLLSDGAGPETSPSVFQVKDTKIDGIGVAHVPPGGDHVVNTRRFKAAICTVDDREPGMLGPISFDPMRMAHLLNGATFVSIDSAELSEEVYNELMDIVAMENTVLAVLTTEERHSIWRMYVGMHWHGTEILEIVPVKDDSSRRFKTTVTRFERNTSKTGGSLSASSTS